MNDVQRPGEDAPATESAILDPFPTNADRIAANKIADALTERFGFVPLSVRYGAAAQAIGIARADALAARAPQPAPAGPRPASPYPQKRGRYSWEGGGIEYYDPVTGRTLGVERDPEAEPIPYASMIRYESVHGAQQPEPAEPAERQDVYVRVGRQPVRRTRQVTDSVNVDLDEVGDAVGVELLGVEMVQVEINGLPAPTAPAEPLHEVECPGCGTTIRARMADAPAGVPMSDTNGHAAGPAGGEHRD